MYAFRHQIKGRTYTWTGAVDSDFQKPGNWNRPRFRPSERDTLVITTGGQVSLANVPTQRVHRIITRNGSGLSLTPATAGSVLTVSDLRVAGDLNVAAGLSVFLSLRNGYTDRSTVGGNLSVAGAVGFRGALACWLTVSGNLSGAGTLDIPATAGYNLILMGASNAIGTLSAAGDGSTIHYLRNGDQTVIAGQHAAVVLGGSGAKNLVGNTLFNGISRFAAGTLALNGFQITFNHVIDSSNNVNGQNPGYSAGYTGTITSTASSSIRITASRNARVWVPTITGPVLNFDVARSGTFINTYLNNNVTIANGGRLSLSGCYMAAHGFTIGQSATDLVSIWRGGGAAIFENTVSFVGRVNLSYFTATQQIFADGFTGPEMPVNSDRLNDLTITANVSMRGIINIGGTLTLSSGFLNIADATVNVQGNVVRTNGVVHGNGTGTLRFVGADKTFTGIIAQTGGSPMNSLALDLTGTARTLPFDTTATGLAGKANLTNGTLSATGNNLRLTELTLAPGTRVINTSGSFPQNITAADLAATRCFNASFEGVTNKFSHYQASAHAGTGVYALNQDVRLTRAGAGWAYAVRTRAFASPGLGMVARFSLSATSSSAQAGAGGLWLGNNHTDDQARPAAGIGLLFNLTTTNNRVSVSLGNLTSTDADAVFTWALNRNSVAANYTDPNGVSRSLAAATAELWQGTTLLGAVALTSSETFAHVKFILDAGDGSVTLKNLFLTAF